MIYGKGIFKDKLFDKPINKKTDKVWNNFALNLLGNNPSTCKVLAYRNNSSPNNFPMHINSDDTTCKQGFIARVTEV